MIRRNFIVFLLCSGLLLAEVYKVSQFESDIFSRDGNRLKKVSLSLRLEGRYLQENDYKITDALNIIISSFYLEDLFTSKGKEQFKTALMHYLEKKYSVEVESIYLEKFKLINAPFDTDSLIRALKDAGCCQKTRTIKKVFSAIEE